MLHPLPPESARISSPDSFTYPFCYQPHPLCVQAAQEVREYLKTRQQWRGELQKGKMFGVLIVKSPSSGQSQNRSDWGAKRRRERKEAGFFFLAAFSGTLDGQTCHPYFVPPVFNLMEPGCYFQQEQEQISAINMQIASLQTQIKDSPLRDQMQRELQSFRIRMQEEKEGRHRLRTMLSAEELAVKEPEMIRQSQYQKAQYRRLQQEWKKQIEADEAPSREVQLQITQLRQERHDRSIALQQWLFRQFSFLNAEGQSKNLLELFHGAVPPSGAGECCAPRLLQAAYKEGLTPLCMAEFWVGESPRDELRQDGHFYPACNSRCKPILAHMLQGLKVEKNPLLNREVQDVEVIYEDRQIAVVVKPHGMLSVPGKDGLPSVQSIVREKFPHATGPMIVHRLDMDTCGLMVIALTNEAYHQLQEEFRCHKVQKTYHALLERKMSIGQQGEIRLPLRPDIMDRPRQMVDRQHGRTAITYYKVLQNIGGHALVELHPQTGRTHQLRVHCAHPDGLGNPIIGDRLYGEPSRHLCLQAYQLIINGRAFTLPPNYELYESLT
ncbi:MAG: RNA pseudouridine synthase [Bacteroidaceae bacterium]|nr:RNA pseudouridine synthase [Bacteroidaceae bacterium]